MHQELIQNQILLKRLIKINLKSDLDKLDIDKFKNMPSNLSNLKSKVDKLDIGKLQTTLVNLSKLDHILKNDVCKKTDYND